MRCVCFKPYVIEGSRVDNAPTQNYSCLYLIDSGIKLNLIRIFFSGLYVRNFLFTYLVAKLPIAKGLLLKKSNNTEVNFIKKVFNKRKRLKSDYTEIMNLMKKYKIDEDVKKFCDEYNKKSLKIFRLFKGNQKDLFINLLISSINRTY